MKVRRLSVKAEPAPGAAAELATLYASIPSFECVPGCTDCCGPISITTEELARLPEGGRALVEHHDSIMEMAKSGGALDDGCLSCPYSKLGRCAVYENRPYACRLFGTVEALPCPHGRRPEHMIPEPEAQWMRERYQRLLAKGGGLIFAIEA